MGSGKKIVKGVVWTTIYNIVNALYGFISVPILIGYFGKAEYGLIGLAMSVNVYMRLMDMGADATNVRFFSFWLAKDDKESLRKGFSTSLSFYTIVGLLNALVLLIVALFADRIFNVSPEQCVILRQMFYVLMIAAVVSWFSSCLNQLVRATENVAWLQMMQLVPKIAQIVILVLTVCLKFDIVTYFLLTSLSIVLLIPLFVIKIKKEVPEVSFVPKMHWPVLKELLPYCLNIFSFSIFQFSFYNLRPVFLGIRGTVESVADFRILNAIVTVVTMLGGAFLSVLLPSSSRVVARENRDAYNRIAYDGTRYISILICLCCFGMMAVGKELLTLYVGDGFLYLLPWLNIWLLCTLATHNQAISSLILAGSDIRAITWCSAFSSVIGLVLSWLLIPKYDLGGVVIAFVAYSVLQIGFYYIYYWPRKMGINSWKVFSRDFIPFVVAGVAAFFAAKWPDWEMNRWLLLLLKGMIFLSIYGAAIFIFLGREGRTRIVADIVRMKGSGKVV